MDFYKEFFYLGLVARSFFMLPSWVDLGTVLGRSWGDLGQYLGQSWADLGQS